MIDFRYHLVSLIAVFLAIALGIVIGTTALNGQILDDLESQVDALETDKRSLEDRSQMLQGRLDSTDQFQAAVAPALVDGALTDSSVLLVLADEDVETEDVEEISALITDAGGTIAGQITLAPAFSDPASESSLQSYATGSGLPAGITLPDVDDAGELVGSLLAQVLMVPAGGTPPDTAATSSVLAGLPALEVLRTDSDSVTAADYAVVLTAGELTDDDAADRNANLVELVAALDAAGSGVVVAGDAVSARENGLVGTVRSDPDLSASVSTVDNAGTPAGRISTVLALRAEGEGTSGAYGTGENTSPVPPVTTP
ncbi:Copper transport outer membrane protein, MctB [Blastococcus aurantiacus]|uniref:Copper transport outer membrane protein, MctB n=1 Tax=Blastococcus aurantiacus TaxID=1550231 RepID=A0A1G7RJW5_9ACTN|nr:copper transporter [Blastococcus aurantiacus]SDG10340.1 Copper transport outer membrane protein, MctB [Blastococcus aurantiacus]